MFNAFKAITLKRKVGYFGILPIVIISFYLEKKYSLGGGLAIFFVWVFVLLGTLYGFTNSIRERICWWISLSPIYQRGPRIFPIYIGLGDIIGVILIIESGIYFFHNNYNLNLLKSRENILLYLFVFIVVAILSIMLSPLENPTIGPSIRFIVVIFIYMVVLFLFNKKEDTHLFVKSIAYMFFVHLLSLVIDYIVSDQPLSILDWLGLASENPRLLSSNITVFIMMLSLPVMYLCKSINNKVYLFIVIPVAVIILLLSLSRMGYITILINGIFMVAMLCIKPDAKYKLLTALLLSMVSVSIIMFYVYRNYIEPIRESSNIERIAAAKFAIEGFQKYPFSGIGYGQWIRLHELGIGDEVSELFISRIDEDIVASRNPHNTMLRVALDMGTIGIIAILFLIIHNIRVGLLIFRKYIKTYNMNCVLLLILLINVFIAMLFGDYLDQNQFWSVNILFAIVSNPYL